MEPTIFYAVITRSEGTPKEDIKLVEYFQGAGNMALVSALVLKKLPENTKLTLKFNDSYNYHYVNSDGFSYLCLADAAFDRRIALSYLDEVRDNFTKRFDPEQRQVAGMYGLNKLYVDQIKALTNKYNTDSNVQAIAAKNGTIYDNAQQTQKSELFGQDQISDLQVRRVQTQQSVQQQQQQQQSAASQSSSSTAPKSPIAPQLQTFQNTNKQIQDRFKFIILLGIIGVGVAFFIAKVYAN